MQLNYTTMKRMGKKVGDLLAKYLNVP